MIKNKLICPICEKENSLYSLTCSNCNSFLRSKVSNIDFWDITWKLFYEPSNTFIKIIQADKKNYLLLITILIFIRTSLLSLIINNYLKSNLVPELEIINKSFYKGVLIILSTLMFSLFITFVSNVLLKSKTRIKDNFSVLIFAFIPNVLAFLFLIPFEIALFGNYWFTANPSPIIIKPIASLIFYSFEFIFIVWSLILTFISIKIQTNLKSSLILTLSYYLSIFFIIIS